MLVFNWGAPSENDVIEIVLQGVYSANRSVTASVTRKGNSHYHYYLNATLSSVKRLQAMQLKLLAQR